MLTGTKNFSANEVRLKSSPINSKEVEENLQRLLEEIMQPLREGIGVPIKITSAYRNEEDNRRKGGTRNSQHLKGEAIDFKVEPIVEQKRSNIMAALWIAKNLKFDQMIVEEGGQWIHISVKTDKNRNQMLAL